MLLLLRGFIPGKKDNTNTNTHIAPTLNYLRKIQHHSLIVIEFFSFPLLVVLWLLSFYYSTRTISIYIYFGDGGGGRETGGEGWYFHLTPCSYIFSDIYENYLN